MNLKEYYKEILTNSLNESELAAASVEYRRPNVDLVNHQAQRVLRILKTVNSQAQDPTNLIRVNQHRPIEADDTVRRSPQHATALRLQNLASMVGINTTIKNRENYSLDPDLNLGHHRFLTVDAESSTPDVGSQAKSNAFHAQRMNQVGRTGRNGRLKRSR